MKGKTKEQINLLAQKAIVSIHDGNHAALIQLLKEVLDQKCPFSLLDALGKEIGQAGANLPQRFSQACDAIIAYNAMGSYVVVGQALICFLPTQFDTVMEKSCEYIITGDTWYVCDIIGERSIGYALVNHFDKTLPWIRKFLQDDNTWVKRTAGTAVHFFSKRVKNDTSRTKTLLKLVEPFIEEKQIDVVKGIGWGLKTIGKYQPDELTAFLVKQLKAKKRISKLMLKKAFTYLDVDKQTVIKKYVV